MTCPKCGGKLLTEVEESSLLVTCGDCGWNVATSYIEPIFLDDKTYRVVLDEGNPATKSVLAAVTAAAGGNFFMAKKLIESAPKTIAEGFAPEVKRIMRILVDGGVIFSVVPDFPYGI